MQTTAVAARITTSAHARPAKTISNRASQITFEDKWLRSWTRTHDGALAQTYDVAYAVNADGDILRARTLAANTLEISYAVANTALTWTVLGAAAFVGSALPAAIPGGGVAIFVSGDNVDVYFQETAVIITRIQSTDKGHTFPSAQQTVKTLGTQATGSFVRMSAPAANIAFFSNSATTSNTTSGSTLQYATYTSGNTFNTSVEWDLHFQNLGMNKPVSLADGSSYVSTLSAIATGNANEYLLAFYADGLRGDPEGGIYTMLVSGAAVGVTPQWRNPQKLAGTASQSNLKFTIPKLQTVGTETWLTCIESSITGGTSTLHLAYFRSTDFTHWTDREYLAGTDTGWTHLVSATPTNWLLTDFLFGQVIVSTTKTYVLGYDRGYYCTSTTLTYPASTSKVYDATSRALADSFDAPEEGDAAVYNVTLKNDVAGLVDAQIGAAIREGGEVTVTAGYVTSGNTIGEEVTVGKFVVDNLPQDYSRGKADRTVQIQARDYTAKLLNWRSDLWHEYASGRRVHEYNLQDLSAFKALNGTFSAGGGKAATGNIDPNYTTVLDNSMILPVKMKDGSLTIAFKCEVSASNTWSSASYVGVLFQVVDNSNYYAITYNKATGTGTGGGTLFALSRSIPTAAGTVITHQYEANISASNAITLAANVTYFMRVQKIHSRVLAWYSTDKATWVNVIDYTFPTTGVVDITQAGYWGVVAKGALTGGQVVGNPTYDPNTQISIAKADGKARDDVSSKFVTPAGGGYLRTVTFWAGFWGGNTPPDLAVGVITDQGDIVANPSKVVWQTSVSSTQFAGTPGPVPRAYTVVVGGSYALTGNLAYYVWLHPVGDSTIGNSWALVGINNDGIWTTYPNSVSNDSGATWATDLRWARTALALRVSIDVSSAGIGIYGVELSEDLIPQTIDRIAVDLATKAGVMTNAFQTIITDAFASTLDTGADGAANNWANTSSGTWATSSGALTGFHGTAGTVLHSTSRAYLRSNSTLGTVGDSVIKCRMKILTGGKYAGFIFRASGSAVGNTLTGYALYIGAGTGNGGLDEVIFTKEVNNTIWVDTTADLTAAIAAANTATMTTTPGLLKEGQVILIESEVIQVVKKNTTADTWNIGRGLFGSTAASHANSTSIFAATVQTAPCPVKVNLDQWMEILIVQQAGYYQLYINEMLCGSFFDLQITQPGYVGFMTIGNVSNGAVANWDNFSVSDLGILRDVFVVEPNKDARSAIQDLIGSERILMQMRYDGALVLGRFNNRASVDTYSTTAQHIRKVRSNADSFSQIQSASDSIQSVRWAGNLLESGRRVRFFSFPDARSDQQAYDEAEIPLRAGQEKATQWEVAHTPVFTAEREDVITLANQDSGDSDVCVLKSFRWSRDFSTKLADGSVVLHDFIS